MEIKTAGTQALDRFPRMVEFLSRKNDRHQIAVPSGQDSRVGESNLYGLLRKNSIQNNLSSHTDQSTQPVFPAITTLTDERSSRPNASAVPEKIKNIAVQSSDIQAPARTDTIRQAELFATKPDTMFPLNYPNLGLSPTLIFAPPASVHLTMGNPSNAVSNIDDPANYLLVKEQYTESYNRDRGIPNWTSWHLDANSFGIAPRQNDFRPDDTLPADWYEVTPADYSGSGYDKGHMTPSGDRTDNIDDNSATFLMTNMIPQASKNNQQTWANLENYCRTLAEEGNELYIISGGQGTAGYIGDGHVAVPEYTWKVIMVQPSGTDDISRVTADTRVISVYIPNNNDVVSDWKQYRVSTDEVEAKTGYDFFSNVPETIQNSIESIVDTQ